MFDFNVGNLILILVLDISSSISILIWLAMLASATIVITLPREMGIRTLVASTILRLIFSLGPEPTLWLLGSVTILLKCIHLVSIMGNHGTLTKTYQQILTDAELVYHLAYLVFCMLGLVMHPFFYSVLVSWIIRSYLLLIELNDLFLLYLTKNFFQLFDVVYREETLLNVIRSVTRNGRSIILTAVLAMILVYMFSLIGYMFFKEDFIVSVNIKTGKTLLILSFQSFLIFSPIEEDCETISKQTGHHYIEDGGYCKQIDDGEEKKERACDSLIMCIVTTLNQGLRNGGGIGDILRAPSSEVKSAFYYSVVNK